MIDRILLFPYYLYLKARDRFYTRRSGKLFTAAVPTISIGNVTAGGTGKTPHAEMILRILLESEEWKEKNVALLSRGYKRESKGFQQVTEGGSAAMYGDEPLQIKNKFPGVTVAVDADRIEGCRFLCSPESLTKKKAGRKCWNKDFPAADIIILDDAFQYRKLKPRLSIVLVDYNRPVFEDRLLPLGRLRDLPERIGDADVIIVTKCPSYIDNADKEEFARRLRIGDYSHESCSGTAEGGETLKIFFSTIDYLHPEPLFSCTESRYCYSKKIILFTGIARDILLRRHLSDTFKIVKRFSFPDHHKFTWSDIHKIQRAVHRHPTAGIATTEKDAQRILDYNGLPREIKERLLAVPIKVRFVSDNETELFRDLITGVGK